MARALWLLTMLLIVGMLFVAITTDYRAVVFLLGVLVLTYTHRPTPTR